MPRLRAGLLWPVLLPVLVAVAWVVPGPASTLAGAAAPTAGSIQPCAVQHLRLAPGAIRGGPRGALSLRVSVRNASSHRCFLARLPQTTSIVEDVHGRVLATATTGRLYAPNPTARSSGSAAARSEFQRANVALRPRAVARATVLWSDWCGGGVRQWGVRLRFGGQRRALYALVISNVAPGSMGSVVPPVPSCHHGARSTVTISPLRIPRAL